MWYWVVSVTLRCPFRGSERSILSRWHEVGVEKTDRRQITFKVECLTFNNLSPPVQSQTSTLSQRKGRVPQPSITFSCQAEVGWGRSSTTTRTWLHYADSTYSRARPKNPSCVPLKILSQMSHWPTMMWSADETASLNPVVVYATVSVEPAHKIKLCNWFDWKLEWSAQVKASMICGSYA